MTNHHLDRVARDLAVEQSLDAAIELSEVIENKRDDAPALFRLASSLIGTKAGGGLPSERDLLANSQLASLSFRASAINGKDPASLKAIDPILELLLEIAQAGPTKFSPENLGVIRDFCLGLNRALVLEVSDRIPEPIVIHSSMNQSMALNGN